ncbi:MFS transporter [Pseudooceanicola nanhaiensis]|uniref:MFS transporter n=1 Tax=Pseudooceanicola nanhaiensis TaxID=375761 RepID=UPI001CD7769F|nr:MFS transporter [Pseudooceanicola nanhaiensis]MCA0920346.1 MFS transporter [Pseudooceanicola nanhaiensis]
MSPSDAPLSDRHRILAVVAIVLSISTSVMDSVAVNVALPSIADALGAEPRDVTVVVGIYQLVIVACLFPVASLAEIFGCRRIYLTGIVIFTIGAALNGFANSLQMLITTRGLQATGAACVMGVNLALLRLVVPPEKLGRTIGINASVVALSMTTGPTIAGALLTVLPWNAVVMMGLPTGVIALVLGARYLPESDVIRHPFDWLSALLSALTFTLILYALMSYGRTGEILVPLVTLAAGVIAGAVLLQRQRRSENPLIPLDLLAKPQFRLSIMTSVCGFSSQMLAFVVLPFALQTGMGYSPYHAGLLLSAWPLTLAATAPIAGRLADKPYNGRIVAVGMALLATGLTLLATMPEDVTIPGLALRLALCGVGFGLFQTPNNRSLIGATPRHRSSGASSALATARLLGQGFGTALATIALSMGAHDAQQAFFFGTALAVIGCLCSVIRSRGTFQIL